MAAAEGNARGANRMHEALSGLDAILPTARATMANVTGPDLAACAAVLHTLASELLELFRLVSGVNAGRNDDPMLAVIRRQAGLE